MPDTAGGLRPIAPVYTIELFAPLHRELIALLRSLRAEQWRRPTACALWSVRDIAAHLLDDDLRRLSSHRDGESPAGTPSSYRELVAAIDALNAEWVSLARRLSPRVLTDLLEVTGPQVEALFRSVDPFAPAHWAVAWAGEDRSDHWFDVGRDYTERWLHQQQIREAVNAPGLLGPDWLRPVLELFMRAVPVTYRRLRRAPGTTVQLAVSGAAGGDWTLRREQDEWRLWRGAVAQATATVRLSEDTAWRLFSKQLRPNTVGPRVSLAGDRQLAQVALRTLAIMG